MLVSNQEVEIWLPIHGYEGLYEVSNFGNVRTLNKVVYDSIGRARHHNGRLMKQTIGKGRDKDVGYKHVRLTKNGIGITTNVHKIVAGAFLPNPEHKPTVNHIDGDKHNNNVSNLEWATFNENNQHAYDINLRKGKRSVIMLNKSNVALREFSSIGEAGRTMSINYKNIHSACIGKRRCAGGYLWRYKNE